MVMGAACRQAADGVARGPVCLAVVAAVAAPPLGLLESPLCSEEISTAA